MYNRGNKNLIDDRLSLKSYLRLVMQVDEMGVRISGVVDDSDSLFLLEPAQ